MRALEGKLSATELRYQLLALVQVKSVTKHDGLCRRNMD